MRALETKQETAQERLHRDACILRDMLNEHTAMMTRYVDEELSAEEYRTAMADLCIATALRLLQGTLKPGQEVRHVAP